MPQQTIRVARHDDAVVLRLDRPEVRNAIDVAMMRELAQAVTAADADTTVRAIVVAGGDRVFSAGRDLKEAARMAPGEAISSWRALTRTMAESRLPIIAAIEGACLTGGLELALACDLRVAGDGATFGITSAKLGTVPGFGATQRLPRLIGASRALALMFSADPIDAAEAHRIGLVHQCTAAGDAERAALALAAVYARRAPLSLAGLKRAVTQGMEMTLEEGLDLEQALSARLAATEDRREGLAAFLERRPPRFRGV